MSYKKDELFKKLSLNTKIDSLQKKSSQCLRTSVLALSCLVSSFALADSAPNPCPWVFTGSLGYTQFEDMFGDDGDTALGRLAIGKEFYKSDTLALGSELSFGLELGVQTGNSMRIAVPQSSLNILGGFPIQTTVKPIIDALATLRTNTLENIPLFTQLKVGAAYRQWQFENHNAIANLSKVSPELQVGLGYLINDMVNITLSYQGIYGGNPYFTIYPNTLTASVDDIPTQNGILLGISFTV